MSQTPLSATEAIHILKGETLSPDWTLSQKRQKQCIRAMDILVLYFNERRYAKGVAAIARQLLRHLEKTNQNTVMDLLKETMAHLVTMFETSRDDQQDKKICADCLRRFQALGITIQKSSSPTPNSFTMATLTLKQEVEYLQRLSPQFPGLTSTTQIDTMLTIQSLIAEAKALHKKLNPETGEPI